MGDTKINKTTTFSLTSLDLPEGVQAEIAKIAARGGSKTDLDTPEELKAAAEALQAIRNKSAAALSKIGGAFPQIGDGRIVVQEGNAKFEYTIHHSGNFLNKSAFLTRRNLETHEIRRIYQDARECSSAYSNIRQIASAGGEIFVIFPSGYNTIGRVVSNNKERVKVIQFAPFDESDWTIKEFTEEGGKLFVKTVNVGGAHRLVYPFHLGAKKFSYRYRGCWGL